MKYKEIKKMGKIEQEKKMKELKLELAKARAQKIGTSKIKEIKKIIARLHTFNNLENKSKKLTDK